MSSLYQVWRRLAWLFDNFLTIGKLANYVGLGLAYLLKCEFIRSWPAVLKIDCSPICNLRCPVCVHADPKIRPALGSQSFEGKYMSVADFSRIVEETKGKVAAFSLYYLGDPYMHPDIDSFCSIAHQAGINVHLSTNFSFDFSDARIERIAHSGVSHITVCVDGFSQSTYGKTRIGGRIRYVLSNLERLCGYRRSQGLKFPKIEVQYIRFVHNEHEYDRALAWFRAIGVDRVESYWGMVNNYHELDPSRYTVKGPLPARWLPRCYWPYATMTIKWNGDAIPCCNFRHATQYVDGVDPKALGNVIQEGVRAVWNSEAYRRSRRLCANPHSVELDPSLADHFCCCCPALFECDYQRNVKVAPQYLIDGRRANA